MDSMQLKEGAAAPRVSVCVVTYNQAPFIRQCLDSVLGQELAEALEIVVGDDCSTDGTREIVAEYAARFPAIVRLVPSEQNRGAGANYFATHAEARGDFIVHIDGDDYMLSGKLRAQLDAMARHPECAVCVHDCMTYDQASERMIADHFFRKRIKVDGWGEAVLDLAFLAAHLPFFAHSTKMYRRSAAEGLVYEGREMIDCHWHLYHVSRGPIVYIDRVLGVYRQGIGVSHQAGMATVFNTRVPSPYLRKMFEDALDYGSSLGVPREALNRSAAETYCRWAAKFVLAGQMEEFAHFARRSRQLGRLGAHQWLMASLAASPAVAGRLVRFGMWGMRFWRFRLAA